MYEKLKNIDTEELCEWFFNLVGYFNHYSFFTKELWRKVKGFKEEDEAEIKCVFMHYWLHHKFGTHTMPCGSGWFSEVSEESYNKYIEHYKPVIEAFEDWCNKQR